ACRAALRCILPGQRSSMSNGSNMPETHAQSRSPHNCRSGFKTCRCRLSARISRPERAALRGFETVSRFLELLVALGALLVFALAAAADEIHVLSSGATSPAYLELIPLFERQTGHKLVTDAVSTGLGASAIPARIRRGEAGDVVLTAAATLDDLIKEGRVAADSRVDLARSSIGMAVRKGAKQPDISTVEALKRKVLDAKS